MKDEIIKCATKLFENDGIKFTLDDIAKDLKISKKSIYKFFSSKEELMEESVKYVFSDISRQHEEILATDLPLLEKFRAILLVYPRTFNVSGQAMDKLIELSPFLHGLIIEQFKINWELTFNVLDQCRKARVMKNISNECFRAIMVGLFDNLLTYENQEEMLKECINYIFIGIQV